MRRLVKEELLRFDGTRLFPERRAYTVQYPLSDAEKALYLAVTDYVRDQMNMADRAERPRRTRPGQLPSRRQDPRPTDEDTRHRRHPDPPRLPR